ncbi:hypothetical protein ACP4OV_005679 [Aristida adscensionis]
MHDAVVAAVHHAVVAGAVAALVALAVVLFLLWRKRRVAAATAGADAGAVPGAAAAKAAPLPVIPLADVERATDGFHRSRVIGQGRHFAVYAAAPGIAAKRMHPHLVLGDPGGRRFPAAVRALAAVPPHPNLAALVGLSEGPGERVLLVERAPAGSVGLDRLLAGDDDERFPPPSWHQRAAVAAGAARGLAHLHAHGVAHGRVRPCNLLVVGAAAAAARRRRRQHSGVRVTDYGLAGFLDGEDARAESDVYMFGAVLLELLTGRRWDGGRLAEWALPQIRAGAAAGPCALGEVLDVARAGAPRDKAEARLLARAARVALACVGNDGRIRPGMAEVSAILSDVEAAYRRRDGEPEGADEYGDGEDDDDGRLSGCLLGPSRSAHKADMLIRLPA